MVKPPADNLSAHEAAEVAWNNHKLRNQSLMVELFDVSFLYVVVFLHMFVVSGFLGPTWMDL